LRVTPALPAPDAAQVWLDFDGTISTADVLDELIAQYANSNAWQELERQWQAGKIGSRECLLREFAMLRVSALDLDRFLDRIPLDPGIQGLLRLLEQHGVPFAILSDGIDLFIRKLLGRLDLPDVIVRANTITHEGQRISLVCPHGSGRCETAAAHCKCASAEKLQVGQRRSIYIGDGRSDLCPAQKAEVVFAKGNLAAALEKLSIQSIPFKTLDDVTNVLASAWSMPVMQQMRQTAMDGSANGNGNGAGLAAMPTNGNGAAPAANDASATVSVKPMLRPGGAPRPVARPNGTTARPSRSTAKRVVDVG
jgi:2-hydroxy-3-keto-5-methylthiopentenyl-1-phosphate phosphatase